MGAKRRVVVQWADLNDLRAMALSYPGARSDEILRQFQGTLPPPGSIGPIKTLLATAEFDEVRLLSNFAPKFNRWLGEWFEHKVQIVPVQLENPTDYAAIFSIVDGELSALRQRADWENTELCIHLSPGTPAMAAVWLLLGKTRYPATFYQSHYDFQAHRGKSWITQIPFDLTIDVVPEILKAPDVHLQHLALSSPRETEGFADIIGESTAIRAAVDRAKRAAMRSVSILLLGESGTGKEMFARAIHEASPRRDQNFVAINCAALSTSLAESELFGHAKGSFTGAVTDRGGAFESANGGTLFLDEIGECDLEIQAKLLRVLQPLKNEPPSLRTVRRVGDDKDRKVDVRVIAATNRDMHLAIRNGTFREDLYYRLAAVTIKLPPLRDRKSDIPAIAEKLLQQINEQFRREEPNYQDKSLSAPANAFVKRHAWPGNVRQLHNVLTQAAVLTDGNLMERQDLVAGLAEMPEEGHAVPNLVGQSLGDGFKLDGFLDEIHRQYLQRAMEDAQGVQARAAELLGIENYQTLANRLKKFRLRGAWKSSGR